MKKFYSNRPLLITLITAFIFMQWSATHIHLAGEHEHDGDHHQHTAIAHQHQLDNHHPDNIDLDIGKLSHSESHKIVELDLDCVQCQANSVKQSPAILSASWDFPEQFFVDDRLSITYQAEFYQSYFQYSPINLRAPPVFS